MASGHYDSPDSEADEDASNTGRFFISTTHAEKIQFACTHYPRKDPPGTRWVYHTSDTYILGAALTAWWKKEKGPDADFYRDLLVVPVFKRLGLQPELATPRRTADDAAQPFTGWGLVLRRDDLAKLRRILRARRRQARQGHAVRCRHAARCDAARPRGHGTSRHGPELPL